MQYRVCYQMGFSRASRRSPPRCSAGSATSGARCSGGILLGLVEAIPLNWIHRRASRTSSRSSSWSRCSCSDRPASSASGWGSRVTAAGDRDAAPRRRARRAPTVFGLGPSAASCACGRSSLLAVMTGPGAADRGARRRASPPLALPRVGPRSGYAGSVGLAARGWSHDRARKRPLRRVCAALACARLVRGRPGRPDRPARTGKGGLRIQRRGAARDRAVSARRLAGRGALARRRRLRRLPRWTSSRGACTLADQFRYLNASAPSCSAASCGGSRSGG